MLFKSATMDKVLPEIQAYKPRVLSTSLSTEKEKKLMSALSMVESPPTADTTISSSQTAQHA